MWPCTWMMIEGAPGEIVRLFFATRLLNCGKMLGELDGYGAFEYKCMETFENMNEACVREKLVFYL